MMFTVVMLRYINVAGFPDTNARKMTCPLRSQMARPYHSWSDRSMKKPIFTTHSNIVNLSIQPRTSTRLYICSRGAWAQAYSRCRWLFAMPVSFLVFSPHFLSVQFAHTAYTYWLNPPTSCADGYRHLV